MRGGGGGVRNCDVRKCILLYGSAWKGGEKTHRHEKHTQGGDPLVKVCNRKKKILKEKSREKTSSLKKTSQGTSDGKDSDGEGMGTTSGKFERTERKQRIKGKTKEGEKPGCSSGPRENCPGTLRERHH